MRAQGCSTCRGHLPARGKVCLERFACGFGVAEQRAISHGQQREHAQEIREKRCRKFRCSLRRKRWTQAAFHGAYNWKSGENAESEALRADGGLVSRISHAPQYREFSPWGQASTRSVSVYTSSRGGFAATSSGLCCHDGSETIHHRLDGVSIAPARPARCVPSRKRAWRLRGGHVPASNIIDIAIGCSFIFAVLSVIVSAVTEAIATVLSLRAVTLRQAIERLLKDRNMTEKLYAHPLIDGLTRDDDSDPAYIPSELFARALVDVIATWDDAKDKRMPPEHWGMLKSIVLIPWRAVRRFVRNLWPRTNTPAEPPSVMVTELGQLKAHVDRVQGIDPGVHMALKTLLADERVKTHDDAIHRIAVWFDRTMEGVGGWYKRTVTLLIAVIAMVLAICLNVDAFVVLDGLSKDAVLRQSVATLVSASVKEGSNDVRTVEEAIADRNAAARATPEEAAQVEKDRQTGELLRKRVVALKHSLDSLSVPMGWPEGPHWFCRGSNADPCDQRLLPITFWGWARRLAGWLFTAIAMSLGAPFWFDLLNKFVNLRAAAPPPAKAQLRPAAASADAHPAEPVARTRPPSTDRNGSSRSDAPPPLS